MRTSNFTQSRQGDAVNQPAIELVVPDLMFPEGLRWHDEQLWFSDVFGGAVFRVTAAGAEAVAQIPGMPSGLGWLPDGSTLVVSCEQRKLLRIAADGSTSTHADLNNRLRYDANDMVVDPTGRAYVGNYGYDLAAGGAPLATKLLRVEANGEVIEEPPAVVFPNGAVFTDAGRSLVVAETASDQLTRLSVAEDGGLSSPQVCAVFPKGFGPDGIDVDEAGAIWVAGAWGEAVVRVAADGEITDRIEFPGLGVYCCVLGGIDGRTLFVATASTDEALAARQSTGQIVACQVDVPAASPR
jgi:sugar lactone lactonase YvrE